jgi:FlaA1/EpsC-like NDP-sugar epimerase
MHSWRCVARLEKDAARDGECFSEVNQKRHAFCGKPLTFIDLPFGLHERSSTFVGAIDVLVVEKLHQRLCFISVQNLSPSKKQQIVDICLNHNTKVLNVPPVSNWINGELSFKQIKKVQIEELLERDAIQLDIDIIKNQLSNKTILVTGAAGSIGSEIVRQVIKFNPKKMPCIEGILNQ